MGCRCLSFTEVCPRPSDHFSFLCFVFMFFRLFSCCWNFFFLTFYFLFHVPLHIRFGRFISPGSGIAFSELSTTRIEGDHVVWFVYVSQNVSA